MKADKKDVKDIRITIRVSFYEFLEFKRLANKENIKISEMVRRLIKEKGKKCELKD